MAKKKYYVVWAGYEIGVFDNWEDCRKSVLGYTGARYKSFLSREEALRALEDGADLTYMKLGGKDTMIQDKPTGNAITVDAACSGNPGPLEYRGVLLGSREIVFHVGPIADGTNNIGEFLAIVHALAWAKNIGSNISIYTDSRIALGWVENKRCKTLVKKTPANATLFSMIERAESWLNQNTYTNAIYKWDTSRWGEIPADFGRK